MPVVRELLTRWGFEVDGRPLQQLDRSIGHMKKVIVGLGAAVAGAATGLFGLAAATANAGNEIAKNAQRLGVTISQYQELEYMASLASMSTADLGTGLRTLSRTMFSAAQGSKETQKTFQKLGVTFETAGGGLRDSTDVLADLADIFQEMPDGTEKTVLAMKLLGRSGSQLIPLLNQGSAALRAQQQEIRDLGFLMEDDTARAGEAFIDAMDRFHRVIKGIGYVVGGQLLPIITKVIDNIRDWVVANKELLTQQLDSFIGDLGTALSVAFHTGMLLVRGIKKLIHVFGGLRNILYMVGLGFAFFSALQVVNLFIGMAGAVRMVAAAFRTMGIMATIANVAAAALPLLIAAGIVLFGLAIEDVYRFFKGEKSITGLMIEGFRRLGPEIKIVLGIVGALIMLFLGWPAAIAALAAITAFIVGYLIANWDEFKFVMKFLWSEIVAWFRKGGENISKSWDRLIRNLSRAWTAFGDFFKNLWSGIMGWFDRYVISPISWIGDKIKGIGSFFGLGGSEKQKDISTVPTNMSPMSSPVSNISSRNMAQSVSINAPINVNVPPGTTTTDATQIASSVEDALQKKLERIMRETALDFPTES